jgi:hypothetical protein
MQYNFSAASPLGKNAITGKVCSYCHRNESVDEILDKSGPLLRIRNLGGGIYFKGGPGKVGEVPSNAVNKQIDYLQRS